MKRVAPLSGRNSSNITIKPRSGQSAELRGTSTCSSWAGVCGRRVRALQRTELERSADDTAARVKKWRKHVNVVEGGPPIHEIAQLRRRAADSDFIAGCRGHGGCTGADQQLHPIGTRRVGNHGEALFQKLRGCGCRKCATRGKCAEPVINTSRSLQRPQQQPRRSRIPLVAVRRKDRLTGIGARSVFRVRNCPPHRLPLSSAEGRPSCGLRRPVEALRRAAEASCLVLRARPCRPRGFVSGDCHGALDGVAALSRR